MPRIPDQFAECSIYLYRSESEANAGARSGGCGFLVHVPSKVDTGVGYLYAVANSHVLDNGFQTLRLTKKTGGIDTISTVRQDWIPHPEGDDVEVMPLAMKDYFKWWSVGTEHFLTHDIVHIFRIGFGDETFLVGRLVNHAGQQKNSPIMRFGNISLMADPSEKIRFSGRDQEAFLVDCRSLSGMSGSAVFVSTSQTYKGGDAVNVVAYHREALEKNLGITIDPAEVVREKVQSISGLAGPWLLGIDLGHIPMMKPIYEADGQTETGLRVDANTGIACVLPAWRILEVLAQDDLMKDRNRSERELAKELENEKKEPSAVQDVADYKIDNSDFTQSDFEADLRKVSRKIQPKKK